MVGADVYVADSFALVSLLNGKATYESFRNATLLTTDFSILEVLWYCVRSGNDEDRIASARLLCRTKVPLSEDCLEMAAKLRYQYKHEDLSYADCAGWALAQQLGVPFLTGDKAFANKPGVAFVR